MKLFQHARKRNPVERSRVLRSLRLADRCHGYRRLSLVSDTFDVPTGLVVVGGGKLGFDVNEDMRRHGLGWIW